MEAKLKLYLMTQNSRDGKLLDVHLIAGYFLEDAFETMKTFLGEGEHAGYVKAVDYEEFTDNVNDKFHEVSIKLKNKKTNVNFLRVVQDQVGDVKLSTAINKLK